MRETAPGAEVLEREALLPADWERQPGHRRLSGKATWSALLAVGVVAALVQAGVGRRSMVNPGGWSLIRRFFGAARHPELDADFLRLTWDATVTTLSYAVVGTALATAIGIVGGVLASETWWRGTSWRAGPAESGRAGSALVRGRRFSGGWLAVRGALALPRGVHEAVWALALINILGLNPLVAVLAIAIPYGAVTAKVFSELLDETPSGAYDGLRAAGAGRLKALCYSRLPQALPDLVSYSFYRFECSIRAATILGLIGAGGLGFQLLLSFQSLRYQEMWTLIYALVILSGLADAWSSVIRRRLLAPLPHSPSAAGAPPSDSFLTGSVIATVALIAVSIWQLGMDLSTLWAQRTRSLFSDLAWAALPPGADLTTLLSSSLETLAMSVLATALACLGGMAVAFLAGTGLGPQWKRRALAYVVRVVLLFCRAIPPPVWALVLLFVLFPGPLPGALALAIYNFGILGRLMAEVVSSRDPRPATALRSQGAGRAPTFLYGVAPVVFPRFVAYGVYRWEVTIRETVVVGLVGAGGLGRLLAEQLAAFDYRGALATSLALVVLTYLVDLVSASVRRSLR